MLLTKLDVVNACLASMGESPANSLNDQNILITSALNALATTSPTEQSPGWYFNIESPTLRPTVEGYYYVPADVLGLATEATPNHIVIRGRRLYDTREGVHLEGTKPLRVFIVRHLPFEDLPFHAQRTVLSATVVYFQKSYDGDEAKIADAQEDYSRARMLLMAEHIRSVRANMLYHGNVAEKISNWRNHTGRLAYRG